MCAEVLTELEQDRVARMDDFWQVWSSEYIRNLPPGFKKFREQGNLTVGSVILVERIIRQE